MSPGLSWSTRALSSVPTCISGNTLLRLLVGYRCTRPGGGPFDAGWVLWRASGGQRGNVAAPLEGAVSSCVRIEVVDASGGGAVVAAEQQEHRRLEVAEPAEAPALEVVVNCRLLRNGGSRSRHWGPQLNICVAGHCPPIAKLVAPSTTNTHPARELHVRGRQDGQSLVAEQRAELDVEAVLGMRGPDLGQLPTCGVDRAG